MGFEEVGEEEGAKDVGRVDEGEAVGRHGLPCWWGAYACVGEEEIDFGGECLPVTGKGADGVQR